MQLDPAQARIITPSGTLSLESSAVAPSVLLTTGVTNVASKGYELWVFKARWDGEAPKPDADTQNLPGNLPTANITLSVGSTRFDTGLANDPGSDATYIVSVPKQGSATLDADVADVDQQLSITTGRRVANSQAAVYYEANREYAVGKSSAPVTAGSGTRCKYSNTCVWSFTFSEDVKTVALSPYDYSDGRWAPQGKAFLETSYDDSSAVSQTGNLTFTLDESGWTATVGTQTYKQTQIGMGNTNGFPRLAVKGGNGEFLVPSDTTTVHLSFTTIATPEPTGSWTSDTLGPEPVPAAFTAARLAVDAHFS